MRERVERKHEIRVREVHETPLISVLLPCRNAAPFLNDSITSLDAQSHEPFEVLAVDDHSTDDTPQILADWAGRDTRVRVVRPESPGLVGALNAGIALARGDLLARMDADDIAHPRRLENQLEAFRLDPDLVACGTHVRCFPRDHLRDGALSYEAWLNSLNEPEQLERDMFVECPIAHPTLMLRTRTLRDIGGYNDRDWPEDYDLVLRLYLRGARMRNVPEVLLDWRVRPDRLSRTDARYSEDAFRRCKVFYLIKSRPRLQSVIIWGAGPVGKAFSKVFAEHGVRVHAFVDVDPRKIGQSIHGAPVLAPPQLPSARGDAFIVAAVSGSRARAEIRNSLALMQLGEGTDFVAVA
jgi:glycosyltransferase involved in cell wall biosynthesis